MARTLFTSGLLGLTLFANVQAQGVIRDDTFFYGQSPPVYPSPETKGIGSWADAFSKAKAMVAELTIEEKVNLTSGIPPKNGCTGATTPIERVGFPGLCVNDAAQGIKNTDFVNSWPSGNHVAASWNRNLTASRGKGLGGEYRRKGVNMMLGPAIGPIGRVVQGGRNWESFGVDPYLSGALVRETIVGVQSQGVMTSTKHLIGQEQETYRSPAVVNNVSMSAVSSNIDDAALHELYLWPFMDAVRAGTTNVMCSYQRLNNSFSCQNSKLLNGILKTELGFQGFVVSDWGALHGGYHAALAGLDMAMPDSAGLWEANLTMSVNNGSFPEVRLDDMATRILASWYKLDQDRHFQEPGFGIAFDLMKPHKSVDARDPADKPILYQGAVEGHVLVKNVNNALPLKNPKLLSLSGYSAKAPDRNMPGGNIFPQGTQGPVDSAAFSGWVHGMEPLGLEPAEEMAILSGRGDYPDIAKGGVILSGGGSGSTSQSTIVSPYDALVSRAYDEDTQVFWDFKSPTPRVMGNSDACLVFGNVFASESYDRPHMREDYTDGLILSVASRCANTIVIMNNAGIRLVDQWIDHPNVTAVIFSHLPGQAIGKALVSLLYGDDNPSGKLPYTVAKNESDYGHLLLPSQATCRYAVYPQSNFTEGVYIDYRHFDAEEIEPRFEFGFGLSYTTFEFGKLNTGLVNSANLSPLPSKPIGEGGHEDLWDEVAFVTAEVTNTGDVEGAEVAQLYLGIPGGPIRQLRGFEKPVLKSGETAELRFPLTRRDLSIWDTFAQNWRIQSGDYKVYVGSSSRNLPLNGTLLVVT